MTKSFTLFLLIFSHVLIAFAKNQIIEINPAVFSSNNNRQTPPPFSYDDVNYLVVQPTQNNSSTIQQAEMELQQYLGNGWYLVTASSTETKNSLSKTSFKKIGYLNPESKLDAALNQDNNNIKTAHISYASNLSDADIKAFATKFGFNILKQDSNKKRLTVRATLAQLKSCAEMPFVFSISAFYETKNPLISESMLMLGVNQVRNTEPFNFNLKGEGIRVGIWDDGVVGQHYDLPLNKNHVIDKDMNSSPFMKHPTYVGGFIAGQGNNFITLRGVAPSADVYYWDVYNDIVEEIKTGKNVYGIDISNHSYNFAGTNCSQSGFYIPEAADLDKLVHEHPTLLPVVAVGNTASLCSLLDTFSSIDIGFQGCKNAITVGWLFSNENIVGNSGRGPTVDGRLKPELVAKGFGVSMLSPGNTYATGYGSSFAAPQIAGVSALMYQQYQQQFGVMPNAALVKAILCNTAKDLGISGPDYTYGFGLPNALKALESIRNTAFFEGNCVTSEVKTHTFTLSAAAQKLSVALSWTDKESTPLAEHNLVNNLDLKLVTPNGDTILPWKLNPDYYKNIATRGVDNLNTIEQVTINNPVVGNYTIVVKGTDIPYGPQAYAVTYHTQKRQIELTHPNGGEVLDVGSTARIKWNFNGMDTLGTIQLSTDSGATWQTIAFNYAMKNQYFDYTLPNVSSDKCLIRIVLENTAQSASTFTIGAQVNYLNINAVVCDKSAKISWSPYVGASAYKVYLFVDSAWTLVAQTDTTTYTISNLINGKEYLYAISTIANGVEGNHSLSKSFIPNPTAACPKNTDVGVYAINAPAIGRKLTTLALSATEHLSFIIKNYGTLSKTSIPVAYRINGGAIRTTTLNDVVTSNDTSIVFFLVNENLSTVGNYTIEAWTALAGDEHTKNDTLKYVLKHLPNAPISLPFVESFENVQNQMTNSTYGIAGLEYADFFAEDGSRFKTNEGAMYARTGNNALTLDNYREIAQKKNELVFTYNLSNYMDSILFVDFYYMNRAEADSNDWIYARGSDTQPWIPVFNLFEHRSLIGKYSDVNTINLTQKLKIENGQNYSTSTQIKIVQTGNKAALSPYGNGAYTFDDFILYSVGKDVAMVTASTQKMQCSKTVTPQPITITVKNNSGQSISNLPVFYQINNEPIVSATLPFIANNDTASYTFSVPFSKTAPGLYSLKTWVKNAGDKFPKNDSFNLLNVLVLPTIDSFPYYNDFESTNGNLFSEGTNNSWVWTTPQKYNISNAAQDNKAWTTGQNKGYNFNEDSYLYLGCLDFSNLNKDPLIAFNFISVMHTQSDSAYAEYSEDGLNWNRLGCFDCGLNWYNGYQTEPYWDQTVFPWQVAHHTFPLSSLSSDSTIMYSIHLLSDNFAISEGLGIDDMHILDDYHEIATADSGYVSATSNGNGWVQFFRNGRLVAELFDDYKNLGNITLGFEANQNKHKTFQGKNLLPRNWVIQPQNKLLGNYKLKLYVLNDEYTNYTINEDSISRMGDIGLLRYIGLNTNLDIIDNYVNAYYKYYSPQQIQFYPYENGYYVALETDTLGEFYLISTKQDLSAIGTANLIDFAAHRINDDVYLEWKTTVENNNKEFVIQYSFDATTFINIDTVPAGNYSTSTTLYNYLHQLNATTGVYYYRIMIIGNTNKIAYSQIDSVYFAPTVGIAPNVLVVKAYISENDIVIQQENKQTSQATINVFNALGQLQFTKKMELYNGIQPLGIPNFKSWSNGALFLQIKTDKHTYYSKLLKQ